MDSTTGLEFWELVIKLLSEYSWYETQSNHVNPSTFLRASSIFQQIADKVDVTVLPRACPLQEAVWEEILNARVPYRLGVAFCTAFSNKQQRDDLFDTKERPSRLTKQTLVAGQGFKPRSLPGVGPGALQLLHTLLQWAHHDKVAGMPAATQGSASMRQQLLDSGVVQLLLELLTLAADKLQSCSAHSSSFAAAPTLASGSSSTGSSTKTSSARSSNSLRPTRKSSNAVQGSPTVAEILAVLNYSGMLMKSVGQLSEYWPSTNLAGGMGAFLSEAPSRAEPTMRLFCLIHQHTGSCWEAVFGSALAELAQPLAATTPTIQGYKLYATVDNARAATLLIPAAFTQSPSLLSSVMESPHLLPFLCNTMAAAAYGALLPQLLSAPLAPDAAETPAGSINSGSHSMAVRGASGSSSCQTDSNTGNPTDSSSQGPTGVLQQQLQELQDPTKAWQFACRQQLPASHDSLLQLAGSSSRGLLWATVNISAVYVVAQCIARNTSCEQELHALACGCESELRVAADAYGSILQHKDTEQRLLTWSYSQQHTAQHSIPEPQHPPGDSSSMLRSHPAPQEEVLVHYLVPTLLLHWAGTADAPPSSCRAVLKTSMQALNLVHRVVKKLATRVQPNPGHSSQIGIGTAVLEQALRIPCDLQAQAIGDVVPCVVGVAGKILNELNTAAEPSKPTPGVAATVRPSSSAESLNPAQSTSPSQSVAALQTLTYAVFASLQHLDGNWCITSGLQPGWDSEDVQAEGSSSAKEPTRLLPEHGNKHAGVLCQLLEAIIRSSLRSGTANSLCVWLGDVIAYTCCTTTEPFPVGTLVTNTPLLLPAALGAGAGSTLQLQLLGQLVSTCKLMQAQPELRQCERLCGVMCEAAGHAIHSAVLLPDSTDHHAAKVVPWLALLGRLCLLVAARMAAASGAGLLPAPGTAISLQPQATAAETNMIGMVRQCSSAVMYCLEWLQHSSNAAQLAAAGARAKQLQQHLLDTTAALEPFTQQQESAAVMVETSGVDNAVRQLQALGSALGTLAHRHACNNIACISLSQPSELQLVGCRTSVCAGCRTARYCGDDCHVQHWKQHKRVCRALAVAAAAQAEVSGKKTAAPSSPQHRSPGKKQQVPHSVRLDTGSSAGSC